jgi:hypothetical protein
MTLLLSLATTNVFTISNLSSSSLRDVVLGFFFYLGANPPPSKAGHVPRLDPLQFFFLLFLGFLF